jgi:AcrR family transcriptional regulator
VAPAYTRLDVDERRRQLLELGADLFTRHSYEELSMAAIAREAGISKALLYHYFPSKRDYFVATLQRGAEELRERTATDPDLPPAEQLAASLEAFLVYIEENADAYRKLMENATTVAEVHELIDAVREQTAQRVLDALYPDGDAPAKTRAAVRGWFWFMDGVCLDWLEQRDLERADVFGVLLGTLLGALTAAGESPALLGDPAAR